MKTLQVDLPDKVAQELETLVNKGWFKNPMEVVQMALWEFMRHHNLELTEQFQLEDIEWAIQQKEEKK